MSRRSVAVVIVCLAASPCGRSAEPPTTASTIGLIPASTAAAPPPAFVPADPPPTADDRFRLVFTLGFETGVRGQWPLWHSPRSTLYGELAVAVPYAIPLGVMGTGGLRWQLTAIEWTKYDLLVSPAVRAGGLAVADIFGNDVFGGGLAIADIGLGLRNKESGWEIGLNSGSAFFIGHRRSTAMPIGNVYFSFPF